MQDAPQTEAQTEAHGGAHGGAHGKAQGECVAADVSKAPHGSGESELRRPTASLFAVLLSR